VFGGVRRWLLSRVSLIHITNLHFLSPDFLHCFGKLSDLRSNGCSLR
jgi:hypothetical protein